MMHHLYFAYGSNLDYAQMRQRCPSARLLAAAILDGYRLGFAGQSASWGGGVATVLPDPKGRVPGLVWTLDEADLSQLDLYEGHPVAYERRHLEVELDDGERCLAHVYVKDGAEQAPPAERYVGLIRRAYRRHGFDELPLALALGGDR